MIKTDNYLRLKVITFVCALAKLLMISKTWNSWINELINIFSSALYYNGGHNVPCIVRWKARSFANKNKSAIFPLTLYWIIRKLFRLKCRINSIYDTLVSKEAKLYRERNLLAICAWNVSSSFISLLLHMSWKLLCSLEMFTKWILRDNFRCSSVFNRPYKEQIKDKAWLENSCWPTERKELVFNVDFIYDQRKHLIKN